MRLIYLAVVVAALGCVEQPAPEQQPSKQQPPQQPGTSPTVTKVRVVVASLDSLQQQCKDGTFAPVDILVDADPKRNEPYHCPGRKLLAHKDAHNDESTKVRLSYKNQDSVLWYSETEMFAIASIAPHEDRDEKTAPKNPFAKLEIPMKDPSKSIASGPIVEAAVNHRYKINLSIGGRIIDPDVWCSP